MQKTILLMMFIVIAATSFSQSLLTPYSIYSVESDNVLPVILLNGKKELSGKFDLIYIAYINKNIAKTMVGFSYQPKNWFRLGLVAGIEKSTAGYRIGTNVWLGKDKYSLLVIADKGRGVKNYFYHAMGTYQLNQNVDVGINAWRFHGIGPHIGYKFSKLETRVWFAPLYDSEFEQPRIVCGLNIKI